jgi:antitoxin component of MazEF toxin-antitoxin module
MPISTEYAVLSKDKAAIMLPKDVQQWVRDVDRFVVVVENDELILRKTHSRRSLDEMVTREEAPLPEEKLEELIHETRT